MTTRAKIRAKTEARRKTVEQAEQIIRNPPLWPWDAAQWEVPPQPESKRVGRPQKSQRAIDRMMDARGVLYRRYVKKAATAKAAVPKAAAARRKIGERWRKRVLAAARQLIASRVPPRKLASRIVADLDLAGLRLDVKQVRKILKSAGILPAK